MNSTVDDLNGDEGLAPRAVPRFPGATYRLQFEPSFTFTDAIPVVRYLHDLGITDCYSSPLTQPRPGSRHGYDVCNYSQLNPELGTGKAFADFSGQLRSLNMGLIADFVPNHMGINHPLNLWWNDVLQLGPESRYAAFFDIDWSPPYPLLKDKVLLPVLGEACDEAVGKGLIRIVFEEGQFWVAYYESRFPVAPPTWRRLLKSVVDRLNPDAPPGAAARQQLLRQTQEWRDPEDLYVILREWYASRSTFRQLIAKTLADTNGVPDHPQSTSGLRILLSEQPYQLAHWKTGNRGLNYRRFFDITGLAGVRVEIPRVFAAVHDQLLRWIVQGHVTGVRIDHPDGLWDPAGYFANLQSSFRARTKSGSASGLYVVAEKILSHDETLPEDWEVHGTTGYDFLNDLNDLFVDGTNREAMDQIYRRFTGDEISFHDQITHCKRMILERSLISETATLCRMLGELAARRVEAAEFFPGDLETALREIIVALRVYRTYLREDSDRHSDEDRVRLEEAIRQATLLNPGITSAIRFVGGLLLLETSPGVSDRAEQVRFVMKVQQLSGPVMAKGLEDTAFYRFVRLLPVNEVGGHPDRFGISVEAFHQLNRRRLERWPRTMLATATHDTKRGEDVRARLNVLSEMPGAWETAIGEWSRVTADSKLLVEDRAAPLPHDEYFLYQTLVGAWPLEKPSQQGDFSKRIQECLRKSMREAKQQTNWLEPNTAYEAALGHFIGQIVDPEASPDFHRSFAPFQERVAFLGHLNSLAQTLIKATSPGVPDFYQGTEFWELSLVDPDNRRPVDYAKRRSALDWLQRNTTPEGSLNQSALGELVSNWRTGWIKLYLIWKTLRFRKENPALFSEGLYQAIPAQGPKARHLFAFARSGEERRIIVTVPRLVAGLLGDHPGPAVDPAIWGETWLELETDTGPWHNLFTGQSAVPEVRGNLTGLPAGELFAGFPVALLYQSNSLSKSR